MMNSNVEYMHGKSEGLRSMIGNNEIEDFPGYGPLHISDM